jgi:proline iminopeptidase
MKELYPAIEPYHTHMLPVSDLHTLYVEESGNPDGQTVVFLHGGPGGGSQPDYRRYFNPKKWRIIIFDQRGCGQSTPFAELRENTTWDLVSDIEKIKLHLAIGSWCVFGGSWGSTLALTYAIEHPKSVDALFLRGIFMLRQKELKWFYQEGASKIYPDAWEQYEAPIPQEERHDFISAFYKRLTSEDEEEKVAAAKAWSVWEASTSKLIPSTELMDDFADDQFAQAFARIECHYFINKGFFEQEDYLLDNIDKIRHIPTTIVQGRYDVVCPMESAWELHRKFPEADFKVIEDAGHSLSEQGIRSYLIEVTDAF